MRLLRPLLLSSLILISGNAAQAATAATVEAVQVPAWLERNGERRPLAPGQVLANRDRVVTGAGARVLIQLPEGSAVKLGENAQVNLNAMGRREGGVYTAALDVLQGAFRFTTGVFQKTLQRRAVNIRASTLTAGVRGTDLWGKADGEKDLICLLEGRIVVTHPLGEAVELAEPYSFASALKGQAPAPVAPVAPEEVQKWAEETEIQAAGSVLRRQGPWSVTLATVATQAKALELYDQVRAAGYPARIRPRAEGNEGGGEAGYRYAVRVRGFASQDGARSAAARLAAELGLAPGQVGR